MTDKFEQSERTTPNTLTWDLDTPFTPTIMTVIPGGRDIGGAVETGAEVDYARLDPSQEHTTLISTLTKLTEAMLFCARILSILGEVGVTGFLGKDSCYIPALRSCCKRIYSGSPIRCLTQARKAKNSIQLQYLSFSGLQLALTVS